MIYGEEAYGMMSKFFDKQEEVNLQQLDFLNKQIAFWQAERDAAEEGSDEWEKAKIVLYDNMLAKTIGDIKLLMISGCVFKFNFVLLFRHFSNSFK